MDFDFFSADKIAFDGDIRFGGKPEKDTDVFVVEIVPVTVYAHLESLLIGFAKAWMMCAKPAGLITSMSLQKASAKV